MKIAVFDSGIGGLSVLHLALKKFPKEDFLYYADVDNVPYGIKSKEEIIKFVDKAIQDMINENVKAIVIACNTATSAAIQEMRNKYSLPLIGMEPAVKKAVEHYGNKRILVIATPMTVRGEKLRNLLIKVDKEHLVDLISLPNLVTFAEKENFTGLDVKEYLKENFKNINWNNYSTMVLGCTHFNYFKDTFRDMIPKNINFIDGNEGTLNKLFIELENRKILENQENRTVVYFNSGRKISKDDEIIRIKRYLKRLEIMLKLS